MKDNFYVYFHVKKDHSLEEGLFYIGKGCYRRAWKKYRRSKLWWNIVKKYDYDVIIYEENLSEQQAYEIEQTLISKYGRLDNKTGILANHTDGGDGQTRRIVSEETKLKMSKAKKGKPAHNKGIPASEQQKLLLSLAHKKNKRKVLDTSTGIVYDCVNDAAKAINVKFHTLYKWLKGENKNKSKMIYVDEYK